MQGDLTLELCYNISNAAKDGKIIVSIVSSASNVPTTKFGTNDKLASPVLKSFKKILSKKVKNMANVTFELKQVLMDLSMPAMLRTTKNMRSSNMLKHI